MIPTKTGIYRCCFPLLILFIIQGYIVSITDAYDPLDPKGNITIKWDIIKWGDDQSNYFVKVSILNYQLFRHIEKPGWKLQWDWWGEEVIWSIQGAETIEQGNCHRIKSATPPHCCKKTPQVIDLLPGANFNLQTANCCKGGVLSSLNQDPTKYGAIFQMSIGEAPDVDLETLPTNNTALSKVIPQNFSLGLPGYTCNNPLRVPASKFPEDHGRRMTQAFLTWDISCTFSQFLASPAPTCCVSLSAFYNDTITKCPRCSCACQGHPGTKCVKPGQTPPMLRLPHSEDEVLPPVLMCTRHMCPIRIHWHVKTSYKDYWRVKITINNLNFAKNYSQWSLVVQHPNLQSIEEVFSFVYKPLNQYGHFNDTGMFWGIQYYNDMLLRSGPQGNVQTEILLRKEPKFFTFREGWAFPRKINFNGQECVMPQADDYPRLPNRSSPKAMATTFLSFVLLLLTLTINLFL